MRQHHGARGLGAAAIVAGCLALALAVPPLASATASRDEYKQQADPICAQSNKAWARLAKRFIQADRHLKFHAAGNALAAIGTNLAAANAKLRLIAPPPGDEARISQWIGIWDEVAHDYNPLLASAYRLGRFDRAKRILHRVLQLQRQAGTLVADFSFQACA